MKEMEHVLLLGTGLLGALRKEEKILKLLKEADEHSGDKKES